MSTLNNQSIRHLWNGKVPSDPRRHRLEFPPPPLEHFHKPNAKQYYHSHSPHPPLSLNLHLFPRSFFHHPFDFYTPPSFFPLLPSHSSHLITKATVEGFRLVFFVSSHQNVSKSTWWSVDFESKAPIRLFKQFCVQSMRLKFAVKTNSAFPSFHSISFVARKGRKKPSSKFDLCLNACSLLKSFARYFGGNSQAIVLAFTELWIPGRFTWWTGTST